MIYTGNNGHTTPARNIPAPSHHYSYTPPSSPFMLAPEISSFSPPNYSNHGAPTWEAPPVTSAPPDLVVNIPRNVSSAGLSIPLHASSSRIPIPDSFAHAPNPGTPESSADLPYIRFATGSPHSAATAGVSNTETSGELGLRFPAQENSLNYPASTQPQFNSPPGMSSQLLTHSAEAHNNTNHKRKRIKNDHSDGSEFSDNFDHTPDLPTPPPIPVSLKPAISNNTPLPPASTFHSPVPNSAYATTTFYPSTHSYTNHNHPDPPKPQDQQQHPNISCELPAIAPIDVVVAQFNRIGRILTPSDIIFLGKLNHDGKSLVFPILPTSLIILFPL